MIYEIFMTGNASYRLEADGWDIDYDRKRLRFTKTGNKLAGYFNFNNIIGFAPLPKENDEDAG